MINQEHVQIATMKKIDWKIKLGISLLVFNVFLFIGLISIPFFNLSVTLKVAVTTGIFIAMKIFFWGGLFLVGKELATKYKALIDPRNWFKKKKADSE